MPDPQRTADNSSSGPSGGRWLSTAWIANQFERSRLPTLLVIVIMTLLAVPGYLPEPTPQIPQGQRSQPQRHRETPRFEALNAGPGDSILVVELEDLFTPQSTRAVRHVVTRLEALDVVRDLFWLDDIPSLNLFGLAEALLPPNDATAGTFAVARQRALKHPLVAGQLLSPDGQTLLIPITMEWLFVADDEDCTTQLLTVARQAAADYPQTQLQFQLTGRVPLFLASERAYSRNGIKFQLIGYSLALVLAAVIFRGVAAVVVVAGAPALAMFWALGIVTWWEGRLDPLTASVLPVLVSMVGLADGVHLMVHIRRERAAGLSPVAAAKSAIEKVGLACGLTSLTTAVGFGSLMLAEHDLVRDFGRGCAIGVCLTFVAVITVIPLACTTFLGRYVQRGQERDLVGRQIGRLQAVIDAALARPWRFGLTGVIGTAALGAYALQLRPDDRIRDTQPAGSGAYRALAHCDRVLGGIQTIHILINWPETVADDDPAILSFIRQAQQILEREPLIGRPISIGNFLDVFPGADDTATRMSYLTLLPEALLRAYYYREACQATVTARVQDLGIARYTPVFDRVEQALAELDRRSPGFTTSLYGGPVHRSRNLYQIVVDLATSLGTASVIIFLMLTLVYRSLRLGLIALTPNLFPLAVTAAAMVAVGQPLDIPSVCTFTVCLGIAVDDTIHFLTRYRQELAEGGSVKASIRRSFLGVGAALVMTTVVLVAGFATVLTSELPGQRIFAAMACSTIGAALIGDLAFLPALLLLFDRRPLVPGTPRIGVEPQVLLESVDASDSTPDALSARLHSVRTSDGMPQQADRDAQAEQS